MGYLYAIEDLAAPPNVLYTAMTNNQALQLDERRRSGTYTIMGLDYGLDPWGPFPAPRDITTFTLGMSVITPKTVAKDFDTARDALQKVVGTGEHRRLIYHTSSGKERVVVAKCMGTQETSTRESEFIHNFIVTWERLDDWQDRNQRSVKVWGVGGYVWGQVSPTIIWGDTFTPFTSANQNFNITADGSDGAQIPTLDDLRAAIYVRGPFGGDVTYDANGNPTGGGFVVANNSATTPDFNGVQQPIQFTIYDKLAAGDLYVIAPASWTVTKNGATAFSRFLVPPYQREWIRVRAGYINGFAVSAQGANQVFTANAVIPIAITGNPTGGSYVATIITPDGVSHVSAAISPLDNLATITTKITSGATPAITGANLNVVSGGGTFPNTPLYVGFIGAYAGKPGASITAVPSFTGGSSPQVAIPANNEQLLVLQGNPGGGSFTLTATTANPGSTVATTATIPWNATAAQVFAALALLPNMQSGVGLGVTGGALPSQPVHLFVGSGLAGVTITANGAGLTGGSTPSASVLPQTIGGTGAFAIGWTGRYA